MKKPSRLTTKVTCRFTRRRLLKYMTAAGFTGASRSHLSVEDFREAASDQVPIKIDVKGNYTKFVDADWYDRLLRARKVADALQQKWLPEVALSDQSSIKRAVSGVWLDAGSGNSEPHVIVSIRADREKASDARGELPERMKETPVEIELVRENEQLMADCNEQEKTDLSTLPGGMRVEIGSAFGTLTSSVSDPDRRAIATAAHVPAEGTGKCGDSLVGTTAEHFGNKIGEVIEVHHDHDIAIIYQSSDPKYLQQVWNPGNFSEQYDVPAAMSPSGIDDLINSGDDVFKYGINNGPCVTSGPASARGKKERPLDEYSPCADYWYDTVRWGSYSDLGPGDSGSPAITPRTDNSGDEYLAVCMNSWRWYNYTAGPSMYAIYRNYNWSP